MEKYEVAVLGGGPGGYVAAIRAAKLGCSVVLIEADHLGGTCLNRGCIPSKTLLRYAEVIELIEKAKNWGIETGTTTLSFEKMMKQKDQVIKRLRMGISSLLKTGKITHIHGFGTVKDPHHISIQTGDTEHVIEADQIILATGSKPFIPPIPGVDHVHVHTSDTIFDLTEIPESIVIIGGGVIGVEFACIYSSFGTEVHVVEMADRLLPSEDQEASKLLMKKLQQSKVNILTSSKVEEIKEQDGNKKVVITNRQENLVLSAAEVLVAVGRSANVGGLSALGLKMNGNHVNVNEYLQTSIPNVYAIGDLIGGWQLAHAASAEGMIAAHNIAVDLLKVQDSKKEVAHHVVPRCIYTHPEIASVGLSEEEARKQGYNVKVETYQHMGNGKAITMDEKDGFVKLIADETYGEILGVVMVGPHVTEMISEASAFMYLEGTVDELANMIHPHPTISETMFEAANAWLGNGLHK